MSHAVCTEWAKTCLCSPFLNHPLSGSLVLFLICFSFFCFLSFFFDVLGFFLPAPLLLGESSVSSLSSSDDASSSFAVFRSFNGFFPCASRSFCISSTSSFPYQSACSCAISSVYFLLFALAFTCVESTNTPVFNYSGVIISPSSS